MKAKEEEYGRMIIERFNNDSFSDDSIESINRCSDSSSRSSLEEESQEANKSKDLDLRLCRATLKEKVSQVKELSKQLAVCKDRLQTFENSNGTVSFSALLKPIFLENYIDLFVACHWFALQKSVSNVGNSRHLRL